MAQSLPPTTQPSRTLTHTAAADVYEDSEWGVSQAVTEYLVYNVYQEQYIGEMETRFIKETEMFFWQFRGQRRPIGIFHGGTFLTAFKGG